MTTLSLKKRPTDRYRIELTGFKRVPLYAATVETPNGEKEPHPGDLIHPKIYTEPTRPPQTFLGAPIDATTIKFIALYHKLDPIPRKRNLIIITQRKKTDLTADLTETLDQLIPGKYTVKKHRGRKAVFISDPTITAEILSTLGDRYTKHYPTWLTATGLEEHFIKERIRDAATIRRNTIEITTSATNNEVLLKILLDHGYYLNVRNIEHKTAKKRKLWYITIYPTKDEHVRTIEEATGVKPPKKKRNIINGKQYYRIKNVFIAGPTP